MLTKTHPIRFNFTKNDRKVLSDRWLAFDVSRKDLVSTGVYSSTDKDIESSWFDLNAKLLSTSMIVIREQQRPDR